MPNSDKAFMQLAIQLASQGEGSVEPNPMVGCVLVRNNEVVSSGWHEEFGGPHAEVNALRGIVATGATAYVTLEPCSHFGKTGPCCDALIQAKILRAVVAVEDPNPLVSGKGIERMRSAGIQVDVGELRDVAFQLLAPYLKKAKAKIPWMIAKWAMTFDGKIATASGDSKWISNEDSREVVHQIRSRCDGVMVGIGTALADDPMLNARLEDDQSPKRIATRIVVDSNARLPLDSKLAQTAKQFPTIVAVGNSADSEKCEQLRELGCEIFQSNAKEPNERLMELLRHLGEKGMTNVLVEGGGELLGSLNDIGQIDECHVFVGAKLLGGSNSHSPVGGNGQDLMGDSSQLKLQSVQRIGDDTYIVARTVT